MESKGTAFDVSSDFIEDQRKAAEKFQGTNIVKPSKFSPYSKAEREKRRKEVARLHFEKGMAADEFAKKIKAQIETLKLLEGHSSKKVAQGTREQALSQLGSHQNAPWLKTLTTEEIFLYGCANAIG